MHCHCAAAWTFLSQHMPCMHSCTSTLVHVSTIVNAIHARAANCQRLSLLEPGPAAHDSMHTVSVVTPTVGFQATPPTPPPAAPHLDRVHCCTRCQAIGGPHSSRRCMCAVAVVVVASALTVARPARQRVPGAHAVLKLVVGASDAGVKHVHCTAPTH